MSIRAPNSDRYVIAHYLCSHHSHGLHLSWVDLARHDGRARLIFWNEYFANARAWSGGKHANIIRNFHQGYSHLLQCSVGFDHGIVRGQGLKFVGCRHKGLTRKACNFFRHQLGIALRGI